MPLPRFQPFSENPYNKVIPTVDNCDLTEDDDLDYYLVAQQIVDGYPPDIGRVQELLDMISEVLLAPF